MIELSPEAAEWLAEHGYDEHFGARPLARVIQEHIKKPLAEELLFGKLEGGGTVRVIVEEKDGTKALGFEVVESRLPAKRDEDDPDGGSGPQKKGDGKGGNGRAPSALIPKVPLAPR
jgi:ATP-dependent Clp protease ATP-binding subunit ClpA